MIQAFQQLLLLSHEMILLYFYGFLCLPQYASIKELREKPEKWIKFYGNEGFGYIAQ